MPVTLDKPGPYASPQSIIEIVDRHRDRGMPSPVTSDVLGRAGIPDSLIPRTIQALPVARPDRQETATSPKCSRASGSRLKPTIRTGFRR